MAAFTRRAALLAALLAVGCTAPRPTARENAAAHPDVVQAPHRLIYRANRLPSLMLPDGSTKQISSLLNVRRPLRYGDYVWNDQNVPAGPVWVRVDLDRQTLSVFRGGSEIGTTLILYGADRKQTPTGVFPILQRARNHHSTLYDAEMPYMLRLTGDGVAIHASSVRKGAATHGCIGVPAPFARLLFDQVKQGDIVAIARGGNRA